MRRRHGIALIAGSFAFACAWLLASALSLGSRDGAADLLAFLGNEVVRPEYRMTADEIRCQKPVYDLTALSAVFHCKIPTACGQVVDRYVHSGPTGKFLAADPLSHDFAQACPAMLLSDVAAEQIERFDQGG